MILDWTWATVTRTGMEWKTIRAGAGCEACVLYILMIADCSFRLQKLVKQCVYPLPDQVSLY